MNGLWTEDTISALTECYWFSFFRPLAYRGAPTAAVRCGYAGDVGSALCSEYLGEEPWRRLRSAPLCGARALTRLHSINGRIIIQPRLELGPLRRENSSTECLRSKLVTRSTTWEPQPALRSGNAQPNPSGSRSRAQCRETQA